MSNPKLKLESNLNNNLLEKYKTLYANLGKSTDRINKFEDKDQDNLIESFQSKMYITLNPRNTLGFLNEFNSQSFYNINTLSKENLFHSRKTEYLGVYADLTASKNKNRTAKYISRCVLFLDTDKVKSFYLGRFDSNVAAALMYDSFIIDIFRSLSSEYLAYEYPEYLNFPDLNLVPDFFEPAEIIQPRYNWLKFLQSPRSHQFDLWIKEFSVDPDLVNGLKKNITNKRIKKVKKIKWINKDAYKSLVKLKKKTKAV